jgi:hypothetical protein
MATRDRRRYSQAATANIATTGTVDEYVIAPVNGRLSEALFSALDALAASDTNFITWTITNLGQAGAGSAAMLAGGNPNTTRVTGGAAVAANSKRSLTVSSVAADIKVQAGDRLRIRAAVTGTLANGVTRPNYLLTFLKEVSG